MNTRPLLQRWTTFVIVTTVLLAVFGIIVKGQQAQNNYLSEKAAHAKASAQVDSLIAEVKSDNAAAAADRAAAAAERLRQAENLQLVLDYAKATNAKFGALVQYLRTHHFPVPVQFLEITPAPTLRSLSTTNGKAKSSAKGKASPKRAVNKSSR